MSINNATTKVCTGCKVDKNLEEYCKQKNGLYGLRAQCKKCCSEYGKKYCDTDRGFLIHLLKAAKRRIKIMSDIGKREDACEFDLTLEDILAIYEYQSGKCYYSNIPMILKRFSNWQCSLERLNPKMGYILCNVALVCLEFNSPDQWTPEKYNEFIELLKTDHKSNIAYLKTFI